MMVSLLGFVEEIIIDTENWENPGAPTTAETHTKVVMSYRQFSNWNIIYGKERKAMA